MPRAGTLALMPALTFAATAQAALWAGLTPLIGDIEPSCWISIPHRRRRCSRATAIGWA